jgi:xanthine dehydrogenase iron-sulfur cluster and FAD-binding subunit A
MSTTFDSHQDCQDRRYAVRFSTSVVGLVCRRHTTRSAIKSIYRGDCPLALLALEAALHLRRLAAKNLLLKFFIETADQACPTHALDHRAAALRARV